MFSEKTIHMAKDCHVEGGRKKERKKERRDIRENVFKSLKSNFKYIAETLIVLYTEGCSL